MNLRAEKFISLFPLLKLCFLLVAFVAFGSKDIFLFSIGSLAFSFVVRIVSGNPYVAFRKFNIGSIHFDFYICQTFIIGVFFWSLGNIVVDSDISLMMYIASVKLFESTLVVHCLSRTRYIASSASFRFFIYSFILFDIVLFVAVDSVAGLESALWVSSVVLCVWGLTQISLDFPLGKKDLRSVFFVVYGHNIEIVLAILPVSLFFLYYGVLVKSSGFVEYLALAYSLSGFLNRPVSYLSILKEYESVSLLVLCVTFSVLSIIAVVSSFNGAIAGAYSVFLILVVSVSISLQNVYRLNAIAFKSISLYRYHISESLLLLLVIANFSVQVAIVCLLITRLLRIGVIHHGAK